MTKKIEMGADVRKALGLSETQRLNTEVKGYAWTCGHESCATVRFRLPTAQEALSSLENHERQKRHAARHSRSGVFPHDKSGNPIHP